MILLIESVVKQAKNKYSVTSSSSFGFPWIGSTSDLYLDSATLNTAWDSAILTPVLRSYLQFLQANVT